MTYEEAIEILQEERDYAQFPKYVREAVEIATSAIKKRIPVKPENDKEYTFGTICPTCRQYLCNYQFINNQLFCKWCGQALDWSDLE
jgi:hypothetical protein|nr:MAG TPA: TFIIB zinc-binding [Caudoviricetes sp.]